MRTLLVLVMVAVATGCDVTPPDLRTFTPDSGEEYRGVHVTPVKVEFSDESDVTVHLVVDGFELGETKVPCSDSHGCYAYFEWDNKDAEVGEHELEVVLVDAADNVTRDAHTVWVDDILYVTDVEVTGETDQSGTLEIEVYAFDTQGALIGCSGSRHGLANVDASDVDYPITAMWIDPAGLALSTRELANQAVQFEVWEDDDDPVCPTVPAALGNTLIGRSPPYTVAEMRALQEPMSFERVTRLGVAWRRDLLHDPGVDPGEDEPWFDFDNNNDTSCSAGGPAGSLLPLAALALVLRTRRRARGRTAPGRR